MDDQSLDNRQLRAFVTLAGCGSFTEAARRLHLSQSAVSHAIKALEGEVRCRLFDRVGKKAHLTQAGEQLLARADNIFREMALARSELLQLGQWGRSRLRIAATPTACQYILPQVLREFRESFPKCTVAIEPGDTPQGLDMLNQGKVDLALVMEPSQVRDYEVRPLFEDELVYLLSPLHPWAKLDQAPRAEIPTQNYVLYNKNSFTFQMIARHFAREDIVLRSFIELGSMDAIKELVKLNIGVGIMAPWVAKQELKAGSLRTLPLGKRKLKRHWVIVYQRSRRLSLPEETFVGLCQSVSESIMP
jgi:DNA-binding transcriptional LysR family regulator